MVYRTMRTERPIMPSNVWAKSMWTLVILSVLAMTGFGFVSLVRSCDRPERCQETSAVLESGTAFRNGTQYTCTPGTRSVVEWNNSRVLVRCVCPAPVSEQSDGGHR